MTLDLPHTDHASRVLRHGGDPIGQALVGRGRLDAEPARQHDGVGRGPWIGQRLGDEFQARTGSHGCAVDRDEGDVVSLVGAQELGRAGEDVEGSDDVEGLHARVGEHHDRPSHVLIVDRDGRGVYDTRPTNQDIGGVIICTS